MYTKITVAITLIFAAILFYLANKYNAVGDFKLAYPNDFVPYYENAANQFLLAGTVVCFVSWIWVNIVSIETKQLFWLCIPILFTVVVALMMSYHEEQLFHFKKTNGMWKGGFSLSYFFGIAIVIVAAIVISINFLVLKYILKQKNNRTLNQKLTKKE